jgi:hypothetical protein
LKNVLDDLRDLIREGRGILHSVRQWSGGDSPSASVRSRFASRLVALRNRCIDVNGLLQGGRGRSAAEQALVRRDLGALWTAVREAERLLALPDEPASRRWRALGSSMRAGFPASGFPPSVQPGGRVCDGVRHAPAPDPAAAASALPAPGFEILEGEGTGADPGGRCPVCAAPVTDDPIRCARCGVLHHPDCWIYARGCAIFGCRS